MMGALAFKGPFEMPVLLPTTFHFLIYSLIYSPHHSSIISSFISCSLCFFPSKFLCHMEIREKGKSGQGGGKGAMERGLMLLSCQIHL